METVVVVAEADIKKWVKEAVREGIESAKPQQVLVTNVEEAFLGPRELAERLKISLVTLRKWRALGLPAHKQKRRVYFLYSEVMAYIAKKPVRKRYEW